MCFPSPWSESGSEIICHIYCVEADSEKSGRDAVGTHCTLRGVQRGGRGLKKKMRKKNDEWKNDLHWSGREGINKHKQHYTSNKRFLNSSAPYEFPSHL